MSSRLPKHLHDALTAACQAMEFVGSLDAAGCAVSAHRVEHAIVFEMVKRDSPFLAQRLKAELAQYPVP